MSDDLPVIGEDLPGDLLKSLKTAEEMTAMPCSGGHVHLVVEEYDVVLGTEQVDKWVDVLKEAQSVAEEQEDSHS